MKLGMIMVLAGMMLGSVACGGDDGGDSPVEQCNRLGTSFCARAVDCLGGTNADEQDCIDSFTAGAACGNATSVDATYSACLDDVNNNSCQELFTTDPDTGETTPVLPDECVGVINNGLAPGTLAGLRSRTPFSRLSQRLAASVAR